MWKRRHDLVGQNICVWAGGGGGGGGNTLKRIDEKIVKGRRTRGASAGIGIRTGDLTQKVCCFM